MAQQIQLRRDTSSNWTSVNPILAQGEIGLETNTYKFKVGDGTTAWNSLAYYGITASTTISTTSPLSGGGDLSANRTLSISLANTSTDGYLSSTDWNTFNNKENALGFTPENVANKENTTIDTNTTKYPTINLLKTGLDTKVTANSAITGATKTKITYDTKGLVTAGTDATTADIADSTNKRYITDAQQTVLGNTSGTNTGDETKTSIETKLGAATSLNNGYLTSTDWSTFNSKQSALGFTPEDVANKSTNTSLGTSNTLYPTQNAVKTYADTKVSSNTAITGATKTKITYDSKGLVTAGVDATTADIADSTDKRYVTDAQLTVLGNTSGTNSGNVTVTDSSTIDFTLTGQALTGSVIQGGITHNNLGSLQGGTTGQYNHLTNTELSTVQNISSNYLKLDLTNTPLTGNTLNFNGTATKEVKVDRTTASATPGRELNIIAGGAVSGGTNQAGGNLKLSSGISTGNSSSDIEFLTPSAGASGTTDRTPTTKMIVKGNGKVGIGTTTPSTELHVVGNAYFSGSVTGGNLAGGNYGDQLMPVYGDGADGYIQLDGITTYTNLATLAGSTYTLTRDIFCAVLNVGSGITLETAGYRIFCNENCIVDGVIQNNGGNASGITAGTGATGGFFRAGGVGAAGLGTASAGANGTAVTNPTANTWVGGLGGRGGPGRSTNIAFIGSAYAPANVTAPANSDGGARITSNYVNYLTKLVSAATPYQFTPSTGGGAGAKSTTGTTAVSGGGGGGGGVIFIASPNTSGAGTIQANGGNGGNASGTGGNFGGGGGGGGGVICVVRKSSNGPTIQANGGIGGTSVVGTGTAGSPVGTTQGTTTTTTTSMTFTPTTIPSESSLMMMSFNIQKTGGVSNCYITSISGFGMYWTLVPGSRVEYNTIASPVRAIEVWSGVWGILSPDIPSDKTITVTFSEAPTNARAFLDEIFNTDIIDNINPITGNYITNRSDSATTLTMTLGTTPNANNGVFTFVGRSGGTVATSTTGTIMGSNDTNPAGATMISVGTTTNTMSHTTAAAVAGFSIELNKPSITQSRGSYGWNGKVIYISG